MYLTGEYVLYGTAASLLTGKNSPFRMDDMAENTQCTFSLFSWFSMDVQNTAGVHDRLARTHAALAAQSFRDIEWIIAGDGPVPEFQKIIEDLPQAEFPIRFLDKRWPGKHIAVNAAVRRAAGRFFLILPNAALLLPTALERMLHHWKTIPAEEQGYFVSITGAVEYQNGTPACSRLPATPFDSNSVEISTHYGISGPRIGFLRTDSLRKHPFPEIEGEDFVPLELVLNRIGTEALTRYVDESFAVLDSGDAAVRRELPLWIGNPRASALYYNELSRQRLPLAHRIRACAHYVRFSMHAGIIPDQIFRDAGKRAITFFMLWPGLFLYRRDLRRYGIRPGC